METKKSLYLVVAPTTECDRHCRHCSFRASFNKEHQFLEAAWIKKLVAEASELGYDVYGFMTAVGEPLMHPKVVELAEAFMSQNTCHEMEFTTSGFLAKNVEEKERFLGLINSNISSVATFCFSYHLYSPTFNERLEQSLGLLLQQDKKLYAEINVICDTKNFFKTIDELQLVLTCLVTKLGLRDVPLGFDLRDSRFKRNIGKFLETNYSLENELRLTGTSLMMPYIYAIGGKGHKTKYLRIKPYMTERLGSAKNLPKDLFVEAPYRCDVMTTQGEESLLYMNPAGEIFPGYRCIMSSMKIGTWETPLVELMARKRLIEENLLRHVLADKSIRWGSFPCHECAALVKRQFSFD